MSKRGDSSRQYVALVAVAVKRILLGRVNVAIIQKSHFDYLLTYCNKAGEIKKPPCSHSAFQDIYLTSHLPFKTCYHQIDPT